MNSQQFHHPGRVLVTLGGVATTLLVLLAGTVAPASAWGQCPRPDRASNVIVMQPGQSSVTFPGSQSADYCAGSPVPEKTQLWTGETPTSQRTAVVPGVGTWTQLEDGRLTFAVDQAYRERPSGDRGPGHDAIMKFAIVDSEDHYVPGIAVAYVLYDGASAFPDVISTCHDDGSVAPLGNDVAGWRGTTWDNKMQATLRPETLRLANTSSGGQIDTAQGTWFVQDDATVRFDPRPGWTGTTPALRYSVLDTFGNTASSTITAQGCARSGSAGESTASPRPGAAASSGTSGASGTADDASSQPASSGTRSWLPLSLALLCLVVVVLALWRRKLSDDDFGSGLGSGGRL